MGNQQTIRQLGELADLLIDTVRGDRVPLNSILQMIDTVCSSAALERDYGHISEWERQAYIREIEDRLLRVPVKEVIRKCNRPWLFHLQSKRRQKKAPAPAATGTSARDIVSYKTRILYTSPDNKSRR